MLMIYLIKSLRVENVFMVVHAYSLSALESLEFVARLDSVLWIKNKIKGKEERNHFILHFFFIS